LSPFACKAEQHGTKTIVEVQQKLDENKRIEDRGQNRPLPARPGANPVAEFLEIEAKCPVCKLFTCWKVKEQCKKKNGPVRLFRTRAHEECGGETIQGRGGRKRTRESEPPIVDGREINLSKIKMFNLRKDITITCPTN
jgi:hypothetical protein